MEDQKQFVVSCKLEGKENLSRKFTFTAGSSDPKDPELFTAIAQQIEPSELGRATRISGEIWQAGKENTSPPDTTFEFGAEDIESAFYRY